MTYRWSFTNYTNYTIKKFFSEWLYYNLWHKVSWKLIAFVWWCTLKIIGMLLHFFYFMDILEEKKHIYIYIYVWKLNQTVLELDFRAVRFLFFPRRDFELTPLIHCSTSLSLTSSALDHSTTSTPFIYIKNNTIMLI